MIIETVEEKQLLTRMTISRAWFGIVDDALFGWGNVFWYFIIDGFDRTQVSPNHSCILIMNIGPVEPWHRWHNRTAPIDTFVFSLCKSLLEHFICPFS